MPTHRPLKCSVFALGMAFAVVLQRFTVVDAALCCRSGSSCPSGYSLLGGTSVDECTSICSNSGYSISGLNGAPPSCGGSSSKTSVQSKDEYPEECYHNIMIETSGVVNFDTGTNSPTGCAWDVVELEFYGAASNKLAAWDAVSSNELTGKNYYAANAIDNKMDTLWGGGGGVGGQLMTIKRVSVQPANGGSALQSVVDQSPVLW